MKNELFPIAVTSWCGVIIGAIVIAGAKDAFTASIAAVATLGALAIAITSTREYRQL